MGSLVKTLTNKGKCPECGLKVARPDKDNPKVLFFMLRHYRLNTVTGEATLECPGTVINGRKKRICGTIIAVPSIKVPISPKKKTDVKKPNTD